MTADHHPHCLSDTLVLRRATPADTDAVADFNAHVHSDAGWDYPEEVMAIWTRDLMSGNHPTTAAEDVLIVEDTETSMIVSSAVLISQTWSYAGIEFDVGRPELVGTHPDYRHRGLVRAQFDVLHAWSAARNQPLQAITGIPWYYRQFGYEMAPALYGGRSGPVTNIPTLKEGQDEPFHIRPAAPLDLPFIAATVARGDQRSLLSAVRDAAQWRYELDGYAGAGFAARRLCIIERPSGEPIGCLAHPHILWRTDLDLTTYELQPGVSWWAVTPTVLRYLKRTGEFLQAQRAADSPDTDFDTLVCGLGSDHPAYDIVQDWLPKWNSPYAWYSRVADIPAFLTLIKSVLEQRLAQSIFAGHTGMLKLGFYRDGVLLIFEVGSIVDIVPWTLRDADDVQGPGIDFPDRTFLQLLFGYRSLDELRHAYPDCRGSLEARLLTQALFPKQPSTIWPIS